MLAMTTPRWVTPLFGAVMLAAAGVLWSVAERTAHGLPRPNADAGIRTRSTRASEEAWLAAHRAALPRSRAGTVAAALTGVLVSPARSSAGGTGFVVPGGAVVGLRTTLIGARLRGVAARQVHTDA